MSTNLREQMPWTAALVDQLRLQHGEAQINDQLRRGIRGEPRGFWARENGIEVGTRDTSATSAYILNERGISVRVDPDWMVDALEFAKSQGIVIERHDVDDPDEARQVAVKLRSILKDAKYA